MTNSTVRILVVEDNLPLSQALVILFKRSGFEAIPASDGVDALKKISDFTPNLILSDLMMPNMNGLELLRNIRSNPSTKTIPFIVLTGKDSTVDFAEAQKLGVSDYIYKPFEVEVLLKQVRSNIA